MTCPSETGNRNVLLAIHFGEADPRTAGQAREHVASCAACRAYLDELDAVGRALAAWTDERPPAGTAERIVAHAVRAPQRPVAIARRPARGALPLLGALPVMGALVVLIRAVASWLPALSFWPRLEDWPALAPIAPIAPFAAAALAVMAVGGLATLAAAPALVLEARR
jgi:hypothetical protein